MKDHRRQGNIVYMHTEPESYYSWVKRCEESRRRAQQRRLDERAQKKPLFPKGLVANVVVLSLILASIIGFLYLLKTIAQ